MKNNKGIVILLGIIIVILGIFFILLATGKIDYRNINNANYSNNHNDNNSIKIDNFKDYVYDAEYKYENKYTEFSRGIEEDKSRIIDIFGIPVEVANKEYLKNLKVPYININSSDGRYANNELENLYLEYAKQFDNCAKDMEIDNGGYGIGCTQILTYRTYSYNNILSIVVIDSEQATAPFIFNYHVYNFDLNSGSLITYNDMLSKLGYNKEDTINSIKELIKNKMNDTYKGGVDEDLSKACHYSKDSLGNPLYGTINCYDITYELLDRSINNNSILFFVDNEGKLNILPILYVDYVQNGGSNHYLIKVTNE